MTAPRQGSVDGEYGFPKVEAKTIRIAIDGDRRRGIVAFNIVDVLFASPTFIRGAGWVDVLTYDELGHVITNGAGGFVVQRVKGMVEVVEI